MLNGLLVVKGIVATITFVAALIAFLTMMQIRKKIPAILPGNAAALRRWHLISGRISLVSTIFLAFIGMGLALYLYPPSSLRPWLHVVAGVLTTLWFAGKVVTVRRKLQPWMKQLLPIGVILFVLHVVIFLTATIWAYWFKITGVP